MSRSALNTISAVDNLNAAWRHVYGAAKPASRYTVGVDGESLNTFQPRLTEELKQLAYEIRHEKFFFQPLRAVLIPKSNHKFRVICVPTVRDRIVQRSLLAFLSELDRLRIINTASYGFIPGLRSPVESAAKQACKFRIQFPWAYKTDISAFFDNIPRELLIAQIESRVRAGTIKRLLIQAVNCEINEPNTNKQKRIKGLGIIEGKGVRQGMPLSPLFANFILRDFDRAMKKASANMVRYADDLIFFANSRQECEFVHAKCKDALSKLHLDVPDIGDGGKTRVYSPDESAEFLGVDLVKRGTGYILEVGQAVSNDIKSEILSYSDLKKLDKENIDIRKFGVKLVAIKGGYGHAYDYCNNADLLMRSIDAWIRQAIQQLFKNGFGINIGELTPEQARFLGL